MRSESYTNRKVPVHRYELEGQPVEIQVKDKVLRYNGKEVPCRYIHWVGLHKFVRGEEEYLVERSVISDSGRLGIGADFIRATNYTEEERAAGRERIKAVATECLIKMGIW